MLLYYVTGLSGTGKSAVGGQSASPGHVRQCDSLAGIIDHVGDQACCAEYSTTHIGIACRKGPQRIVGVLHHHGHGCDQGVERLRRKIAKLTADPLTQLGA